MGEGVVIGGGGRVREGWGAGVLAVEFEVSPESPESHAPIPDTASLSFSPTNNWPSETRQD